MSRQLFPQLFPQFVSTACEQGRAQAYELTEYDRVVLILNFMGFSITIFD